jgi:hypothetical protein
MLTWSAVAGATAYAVQVSTVADFATQVVNQSNISTLSYAVTGLLNATTYYWRVNAANSGGTGTWTAPWSFVTIAASPSAPALNLPANAVANIPTNPVLTWSAVAGATAYTVQIATSAEFTTPIVNQSGITVPSYTAGNLLNNTTYYWRVSAVNAGGTGEWSGHRSFKTIIARPTVPVASSPDSGAMDVTIAPAFFWHPAENAASYHVQLSTDAAFTLLLLDSGDIRDTLLSLDFLSNSTTYFWRVSSVNEATRSPWMPGRSFTTICKKPAPVATVPFSSDTLRTDSLVCRWTSTLPQVTNYHLQVFSDAALSVLTFSDSTLPDTSFVIRNLHNNQTLLWRVRACNVAGYGPFSDAVRAVVQFPSTAVQSGKPLVASVGASCGNGTVRYGIPVHCAVTITVYDIAGRSVWKYGAPDQQPGYYTVKMHKAALSAGRYFLQFVAGDYRRVISFVNN